jgi:hypothetical protein
MVSRLLRAASSKKSNSSDYTHSKVFCYPGWWHRRCLKGFENYKYFDVEEPDSPQDARWLDPSRLNLAANFGRLHPMGPKPIVALVSIYEVRSALCQ